MTTHDNRSADNGGMITVEPTAAEAVAAMVALAVTPPPPPLTAAMTTPCGPSTSTPGPAGFRCGLVPGGRRPTTSPSGHASRRSHIRSSSAADRTDLHTAPDASTTGIVATVDELFEPTGTGSLLPHHDDGSSRGHCDSLIKMTRANNVSMYQYLD
jgi:hypothetical protein